MLNISTRNFFCRELLNFACAVLGMLIYSQQVLASQHVYFGTGSNKDDGIYHAILNDETGKLSMPTKVADIRAPGFLAKHPKMDVLYAVAVVDEKPVVAAFQASTSGTLTLINSMEIGDGGGAHIAVHPSGRFLLTAQYGGGSVALFSLKNDGALIKRVQLIEHQGGSNVVKGRQENPHPHWVGFSPDGRFAFVPDLGLDKAVIYRVSERKQSLVEHGQAVTVAGGGPRHMRFSTNGKFIYLLNELTLSITVFAYDLERGQASKVSVVPVLPEKIKAQEAFNSASEILVHPSGKYVYSANRGHDSVSVFASDELTGELTLQEIEHVRGSFPRNINMDKNGKWLLAAGQHSNTVSVFAIDGNTGLLQYQTGGTVNVPNPICILFW